MKTKKTVADFLEQREKSKKVKTLTQCFKNQQSNKEEKRPKDAGAKRLIIVNEHDGNGLVTRVYDPKKKYAFFLPRHNVPCCREVDQMAFHFTVCKTCNDCCCPMCKHQEYIDVYRMNASSMREHEYHWMDATRGMRAKGEIIDEEWLEAQDPVWAQLKEANEQIKEDIGHFIEVLESTAMTARENMKEYGIFYPETTNY